MAELRWSILCYRGCVDKFSNMLSLLDVTDEITIEAIMDPVPENPSVTLNLQLVSLWRRSEVEQPEKLWSTFTVRMPDGNIFLAAEPLEIDLESNSRTRLIFRIQAIPFAGIGIYWFIIGAANRPDGPFEPAAMVPLEVKLREVASISPEQPSESIPASAPESS